jgi:hypothetical protein
MMISAIEAASGAQKIKTWKILGSEVRIGRADWRRS